MIRFTVKVDAPHAELGTAERSLSTQSANAVVSFIVGITNEHPGEELTFVVSTETVQDS